MGREFHAGRRVIGWFAGTFGGPEYASGVIELKGTSDPMSRGGRASLPAAAPRLEHRGR